FGWHEAEFRSTWDESLRLKRTMRLAWLWSLLGRLYPRRGARSSGASLESYCWSDSRRGTGLPPRQEYAVAAGDPGRPLPASSADTAARAASASATADSRRR